MGDTPDLPEDILAEAAKLGWPPEGGEGAMARLAEVLPGRTHSLGRDHLLAPAEQLPELEKRLSSREGSPETRALRWSATDLALERAYTDLAYW